ncbi:MAG: alpha/beta hydrolase [Actinobacteria bacterium]|nr:alpha/beta hydrolase [Actinomycetota bacterium]
MLAMSVGSVPISRTVPTRNWACQSVPARRRRIPRKAAPGRRGVPDGGHTGDVPVRRSLHCLALDLRGFGDTAVEPGWRVRWGAFGDDALAAARVAAASGPVIGAGHSLGGSSLVMAALREPSLFRALVLYEPIIFPASVRAHRGPSPLAEGARRRRRRFASFDDALANYAAKPPMNAFDPAALRAYVAHGFRDDGDGVVLKCDPEHEAQTYETGSVHETWDQLADLRTPVWLVSGAVAPMSPASFVEPLAATIAAASRVRPTVVSWPDRGHFGPLEDPSRFASLIMDVHRAAPARPTAAP